MEAADKTLPGGEATAVLRFLRRPWRVATYGLRRPGRRLAGLVACGVVGGVGESLVVVLVVGLVSPGRESALPFVGGLPGTWSLAGAGLALVALLAVAHAGAAWISARSARDVQSAVQRQLVEAYLGASSATQSSSRTGELQELVTVRSQILAYGAQETAQALSAALNVVVLVVAAVVLSPFATLGLTLAVATVLALSLPLRRMRRNAVGASTGAQASLAVELTEAAELARDLRVFGVDGIAAGRLGDRIDDAARRQGRVRLSGAVTPPLTRDITVALVILALAVVVSSGSVDTVVLGASVVLVLRALAHAQSLSSFSMKWTEREDVVERIDRRLRAWRAPAAQGVRPCPRVDEIVARGVAFSYEASAPPALDGVDLHLRRGELVGIIGRTGGGKSTLAGVLLGLLVPTRGEVLVDGVALAEIDPRDWHARTAWVGQQPRLLTGTVRENIRFLREEVDDADVARGAHDAGLTGELALDHPVGPSGAALSGGQRQRVALARALAGRPDVVVLDEPTSALDVHTEAVVRDSLDRLREDRIVVVIAHRLSTLRTCDRVVVMEGGRIARTAPTAEVAGGGEAWLHDVLGPAGG